MLLGASLEHALVFWDTVLAIDEAAYDTILTMISSMCGAGALSGDGPIRVLGSFTGSAIKKKPFLRRTLPLCLLCERAVLLKKDVRS